MPVFVYFLLHILGSQPPALHWFSCKSQLAIRVPHTLFYQTFLLLPRVTSVDFSAPLILDATLRTGRCQVVEPCPSSLFHTIRAAGFTDSGSVCNHRLPGCIPLRRTLRICQRERQLFSGHIQTAAIWARFTLCALPCAGLPDMPVRASPPVCPL